MMGNVLRPRGSVLVAALSVIALAATACGSSSDDVATPGSSAGGEKISYTFVYPSAGTGEAVVRQAMKNVDAKYGYSGEFVDVAESEIGVSGVASGKFDFVTGVASTVMAAQQSQNAPITFIAQITKNDWTLAAKAGINGCADMNGKRMGLHSPGGVSTALYKAWFDKNCDSSVKPKTLYVPGSPNRLQGLVANQLDITMLQAEDTLDLPEGKFHLMANFAKDLPEIETSTMAANDDFLKKHPEVAVHLIEEILKVNRANLKDASVWAKLITEHKPELAKDAERIAKLHVETGYLDGTGSMSYADMQATIDLYVQAGALKSGLKAEDIADRQYLDKALATVGSA
jgi:ABC-type nitrate/sulfonate/bicarbonate transport system substrate-binding protein